jgi:hypothetical protein
MVQDDNGSPIVLLGAPGSGKSALLARFCATVRADGIHVVAIKADRLPATIRSTRDLRDHLGFQLPVASAVCSMGQLVRTVLVIDQLDALSDLLDVRTERLSVLLDLIELVRGAENIRIICSARLFDYRHDVRFERLSARELQLALPDMSVVDEVLSTTGHNPKETPEALRQLLRTPQWLKAFLSLNPTSRESLPTTWNALLELLWRQKVAGRPDAANGSENAVRRVAREIAEREELWIPRAALQPSPGGLDQLISRGVLALDAGGHRIGFAHQLLYEFARARTFLGDESLVEYVCRSQNSLFVRPTLWTALGYLRSADPNRYSSDIEALWSSPLRRHVRLLLVEFMGQQQEPDDTEASLLLPLLEDCSWQRTVFAAVAGSRGWFERLRHGYLQLPMRGADPGSVLALLHEAVRFDSETTLALLKEHWTSSSRFAPYTLAVLGDFDSWSESAFTLADEAIALTQDRERIDGIIWHLAQTQPVYAIRIVANSLDRELTRVLQETVPSAVPDPDATEEQRVHYYVAREPRNALSRLLSAAAHGHSSLRELAKAEPGCFLQFLLPWLSRLLVGATDLDTNTGCYLDDYLIESKPVDDLPCELPDALRIASQELAKRNPERFLDVVKQWRSSELLSVHVTLSFGLEFLAVTHPSYVMEYLLGDPRRLCIGNLQDRTCYTVALLSKLRPQLETEQVAYLERAIRRIEPAYVKRDRSVDSRLQAHKYNRHFRLVLLRTMPDSMLSVEARALIEQETRVFDCAVPWSCRTSGLNVIGSPMSAIEMAKASDGDIVNLFDELTDNTRFEHPQRAMEGGSVQAAREFAAFAKQDPERALRISTTFRAGQQEKPAAEMLDTLAETQLATVVLEKAVMDFDRRGFVSEDFRTMASWALEKRAYSGLGDATIETLISWIAEAPRNHDGKDKDGRGHPPFLWGLGGGGILPRGGYPMLSTITVALLSRTPPETARWLQVLEDHLQRGESFEVWLAFMRYLKWLHLDATRGAVFLDSLFTHCHEVLESAEGVRLLAQASWWLPPDQLQRLTLRLRDGAWPHGKRAFGELLGLLGVREPALDWARAELAHVLHRMDDESVAAGLGGMCTEVWTSPWRQSCTNVLERVVLDGGSAARDEVVHGLHSSRLIVDQDSKRILVALTRTPEAFLTKETSRAMEWVSGLLHSYPMEVLALIDGLVQTLETRRNETPLLFHAAADAVVNLSVTFQRLPRFRDAGLDIFERILALGIYSARRALDDADAWPRYRRTM